MPKLQISECGAVKTATDAPNDENAERMWWSTYRNLAHLSLFGGALHAATWAAEVAMSQVHSSKSCCHKRRKWK
jgi:hypothetical protein